MSHAPVRIVYMGTPEFAVAPLDALVKAGNRIVGVVTAPDKPSGRGKKLQSPAVRQYADEHLSCPVFQPEKLRDPEFADSLRALEADIFMVVAFRMLPEVIWKLPPKGTVNLHASLLPQYRGAAPINWVIMNGEEETGVTTFLIDEEIDTGRILMREKVWIGGDETAGSLHDRLMVTGSELVVRTVDGLASGNLQATEQSAFDIPVGALKKAPKIYREDCRINWMDQTRSLHNLVRGLSPYPGAFCYLSCDGNDELQVKIFETRPSKSIERRNAGSLRVEKQQLYVQTGDGELEVISLQPAGKRRMTAADFLNGFHGEIRACKMV